MYAPRSTSVWYAPETMPIAIAPTAKPGRPMKPCAPSRCPIALSAWLPPK